MKLFRATTTVKGHMDGEPYVDWYEAETLEQARELWDEDCHRYQLPMDKVTVEFVECDPVTLVPVA